MESKLYLDSNLKGRWLFGAWAAYSLLSSTEHNRDSQYMAGVIAHSPITIVTIITFLRNIWFISHKDIKPDIAPLDITHNIYTRSSLRTSSIITTGQSWQEGLMGNRASFNPSLSSDGDGDAATRSTAVTVPATVQPSLSSASPLWGKGVGAWVDRP